MQLFSTPLNIRGASQQNGRRWGLLKITWKKMWVSICFSLLGECCNSFFFCCCCCEAPEMSCGTKHLHGGELMIQGHLFDFSLWAGVMQSRESFAWLSTWSSVSSTPELPKAGPPEVCFCINEWLIKRVKAVWQFVHGNELRNTWKIHLARLFLFTCFIYTGEKKI